jgi:hemerythrin superfamily protein
VPATFFARDCFARRGGGYSKGMQIDTSTLLPARGNDAVEILKNDHQVIKGLLNQLTGATQSQQRKQVLEQLKGVLTVHNATEENLVYPAIDKVGGGKQQAEHLYHETAEADMLFFELDSILKEGEDTAFVEKAKNFHEAVLHHIEEEEGKAFPHLQENSDAEHSKELADAVREFRKSLHFEAASA